MMHFFFPAFVFLFLSVCDSLRTEDMAWHVQCATHPEDGRGNKKKFSRRTRVSLKELRLMIDTCSRRLSTMRLSAAVFIS